jgi:hypothetical protein
MGHSRTAGAVRKLVGDLLHTKRTAQKRQKGGDSVEGFTSGREQGREVGAMLYLCVYLYGYVIRVYVCCA